MQVPRIYAIADAQRWAPRPLPEVVSELAAAGWQWIQVRDKQADDRSLLSLADACVAGVGPDTRVWINDRADIAAMAGAWGVHLGDDDPPPEAVREAFDGLRIGRTTRDPAAVAAADADPAVDVVAFGPIFATDTKQDAPEPRGIDAFDAVRDLTDKPLIAVGGISAHAVPDLRWAGANLIAVTGVLADNPRLVTEWVSRYAQPARTTWPRVFLTGFMTSGKSCVGRRLAAVLGWDFVDLDRRVMRNSGRTVAQVFDEQGEAVFRARESATLEAVCDLENVVVACGGGVLKSAANRSMLDRSPGMTVWLDVSEAEIERRLAVADPAQRPLAGPDWRWLLADRRQRYASAADGVVEVSQPEPIRQTTRRVYDRLLRSGGMEPSA